MQFEHRDLHWGNLLLRRGPPRALCHKLKCAQSPCCLVMREVSQGAMASRQTSTAGLDIKGVHQGWRMPCCSLYLLSLVAEEVLE